MKTVSIGIPAHNEGKNIYCLLTSILSQTQDHFKLKEIIISLDGCTDNTESEIKKIDEKKIILISDKNRLGKVKRLNQMYSKFTGNVFIQFDGDVRINDPNLIDKIIKEFLIDAELDVLYGMQIPLPPETLIGQLAYFGFYTWETVKKKSKKNVERYNVFGQITAFSRRFLDKYRIPEEKYLTEDTYSFYYAKFNNYKTLFKRSAAVYFKLPQTLFDYTNQMSRYLSTSKDMQDIFGENLINYYETVSRTDKLRGLYYSISYKNFHIFVLYILMQTITKLYSLINSQKIEWVTISTSK
jgi:glycosyltransferase involved in cell wall biosynthesis